MKLDEIRIFILKFDLENSQPNNFNCLIFILVQFFPSKRDQTKQTLTVTLLFQCNFLLVVGADNLV